MKQINLPKQFSLTTLAAVALVSSIGTFGGLALYGFDRLDRSIEMTFVYPSETAERIDAALADMGADSEQAYRRGYSALNAMAQKGVLDAQIALSNHHLFEMQRFMNMAGDVSARQAFYSALVAQQLGNDEEAFGWLEKSWDIEIRPSVAMQLSAAYFSRGQIDKAIDVLSHPDLDTEFTSTRLAELLVARGGEDDYRQARNIVASLKNDDNLDSLLAIRIDGYPQ